MKFRTRPREVEAERITAENAERLCNWCRGSMTVNGNNVVLQLPNGVWGRDGDWLVKEDGFKIIGDKFFREMYDAC